MANIMQRPATLNIGATHRITHYQSIIPPKVAFIHGTNSAVFDGLIHFGALLSMQEMSGEDWFEHHPLASGELGYTIEALGLDQPISQGVSLCRPQHYREAIRYANLRSDEVTYPVLIGIDNKIDINRDIIEHPVSCGRIDIDRINAIYVPRQLVDEARRTLQFTPRLDRLVCPFDELS